MISISQTEFLNKQYKAMTYRDKLQEMIQQLWKIYDEASALRDISAAKDKAFINNFRGGMHNQVSHLTNLDDQLTDPIANQKY